MSRLRLAVCDRALPPSGGAPDWVHLIPAGRMQARDGRVFDLVDPAAVILDFQQRAVDLPVDYEHQMDRKLPVTGPVPAAGWIKELAHDDTGLWGRVEWTAVARDMISRKEYRYLSPVFLHNAAGQIQRLSGAGLVHKPALRLKALASENPAMSPDDQPSRQKAANPPARRAPQLAPRTGKPDPSSPWSALITRLLSALELPADATEEEALDALEVLLNTEGAPHTATAAQRPDPARFVPIEAVRDLMADRNLHLATLRETEARDKVNAALRAGHITPAMRDWATALCTTDPASFDAFVARSPAPFAHLHKPVAFGAHPSFGATGGPVASDAELAICAQLGLTPERLARG